MIYFHGNFESVKAGQLISYKQKIYSIQERNINPRNVNGAFGTIISPLLRDEAEAGERVIISSPLPFTGIITSNNITENTIASNYNYVKLDVVIEEVL